MNQFEISHNGTTICKIIAKDNEQAIKQAKVIFASDDRIRPWRLYDINDNNILARFFTVDQMRSNDSILAQL